MKNPIEYHSNLINDINKAIEFLLEDSDSKRRQDISDIRDEIDDLRELLRQSYTGNFPYNSIRIKFNGEYELKLPKYGMETFDRKLKGEMYFTILGGNNDFMDIATTSFPKTFRIRLYYKTLELFKTQSGKSFLLYERGREKLEGEKTKIDFKIVKLS
jgi:hypothetical protein